MAIELGAAYISILPSTTKLASAVAGEFTKIEGDAKAAGSKIGSALAGGVKPIDVKINTPSIPTPDAPTIPDADTGSFGSSLKSAMGPIGAIAGGVLGVALVGGLKAAMDREAGRDLLAAQLGLGPKEAARLGRISGGLYQANFGESIGQVNDVLATIVQNVPGMADAANAKLEGFTSSLLSQAAITGEDAGRIAQVVGQMIKTGMADSANEALNVITTGFQQGLNKDDDFLDTLNEYGTQFRKLGIDGGDALTLISQGMKAGARDSDIVADVLKEFSIRAVDGSDLTQQAFISLGLDFDAMTAKIAAGGSSAQGGLNQTLDALRAIEDPAERSAIAVKLFGTQSEDMGAALYKMDLTNPKAQLDGVRGAAAKASDAFGDNALGKLTSWYRTMKTKVVDFIAATALPTLNQLTDFLSDKVGPAFNRAVNFAKKGEWTKAWHQIRPIVKEVWAWIVDHTKQWGDKIADIGYDIGLKIGNRIAGGVHDSLANEAGGWVGRLIHGTDEALGNPPGDTFNGAPPLVPIPHPTRTPLGGPGGALGRGGGTHVDNRIFIDRQYNADERAFQRRRQAQQRQNQPLGVG